MQSGLTVSSNINCHVNIPLGLDLLKSLVAAIIVRSGICSSTRHCFLVTFSLFQPKSTILGLIKEMAATFEDELPLYSLSAAEAAKQKELLSFISRVTDGKDIWRSSQDTGTGTGVYNTLSLHRQVCPA